MNKKVRKKLSLAKDTLRNVAGSGTGLPTGAVCPPHTRLCVATPATCQTCIGVTCPCPTLIAMCGP